MYEFAHANNIGAWRSDVSDAWCVSLVDRLYIDGNWYSTFLVYQQANSDWQVAYSHPGFSQIGCALEGAAFAPTARPTRRPTRVPPTRTPQPSISILGDAIAFYPTSTPDSSVSTDATISPSEGRTFAHEHLVTDMAWSPDGLYLATANEDHVVRIWDVQSGTLWATIATHAGSVSAVSWSPDGTRIATSGEDGYITVWDLTTRANLLVINRRLPLARVRWSPDGVHLISVGMDDGVRVWDAATGVFRRDLRLLDSHDIQWAADGSRFAVTNGDSIHVYVNDSWRESLSFSAGQRYPSTMSNVSLSYDAAYLAGVTLSSTDGMLMIWDTITFDRRANVVAYPNAVHHALNVGWSPVDLRLFTYDTHGSSVDVWSMERGTAVNIATSPTGDDSVNSAAWSPDGQAIAIAFGSHVTIWTVP
ncbi:MAG: hypothetical protein U0694_21760 [Anaerolineae bacterium]